MGGKARAYLRHVVMVSVLLVCAAAALGAGGQVAAAASVYGPGSSGWDAYYANPLDTATWGPFCAGAGATKNVFVPGVPVPACGPTGATQIDVPLSYPYTAGGETTTPGFQCTELVERYLYVAQHWGAIPGNGATTVTNYASNHGITAVFNGTAGKAPHVGDVISFSVMSNFSDGNGQYPGHTAIVSASSVNSSGNGYIKILSQNWSGGAAVTKLTVTTWSVQAITTFDSSGNPVNTPYIEWLPTGTPPLGPPPPAVTGVAPPGSSPNLNSAVCPSTSSCVAVGFAAASPLEPLVVAGSGVSWKAISAPLPVSANLGGLLYSVACPSTSSCAAVGYADVSGDYEALLETGSQTKWAPAVLSLPANPKLRRVWGTVAYCIWCEYVMVCMCLARRLRWLCVTSGSAGPGGPGGAGAADRAGPAGCWCLAS